MPRAVGGGGFRDKRPSRPRDESRDIGSELRTDERMQGGRSAFTLGTGDVIRRSGRARSEGLGRANRGSGTGRMR